MSNWNEADPVEAATRLIGTVDIGRDWAVLDQQFKGAHDRAVGATEPTAPGGPAYESPAGRREHTARVQDEIKRLWLAASHAHPDAEAAPSF